MLVVSLFVLCAASLLFISIHVFLFSFSVLLPFCLSLFHVSILSILSLDLIPLQFSSYPLPTLRVRLGDGSHIVLHISTHSPVVEVCVCVYVLHITVVLYAFVAGMCFVLLFAITNKDAGCILIWLIVNYSIAWLALATLLSDTAIIIIMVHFPSPLGCFQYPQKAAATRISST